MMLANEAGRIIPVPQQMDYGPDCGTKKLADSKFLSLLIGRAGPAEE